MALMLAGCGAIDQRTEHDTSLTWCVGYCGRVDTEGVVDTDREETELPDRPAK